MPVPQVNNGELLTSTAWNNMANEVNSKVNKAGDTMSGPLTVNGAIRAGTSEIYFTQTNHNHSAIGNAEGFAAIENGVSHGSLMILGRAFYKNGALEKRVVKLWDYLSVEGELNVVGNLSFGERTGQMINLCGTGHGIGVQYASTYFRSSEAFYWYQGGVHDFNRGLNSGGGKEIMSIFPEAFHLPFCKNAYKQGAGGWAQYSDARLKKKIHSFEGALEKLSKLKAVNFEWKDPTKMANEEGVQTGFLAQEVEKVFPDWVTTDRNGLKCITYKGFEALVVESLKELKSELNSIKKHLNF